MVLEDNVKSIPGYEGLYSMDDEGRVWNKWNKEMKPCLNRVKLYKDGKYQSLSLDLLRLRTIGLKAMTKEQVIVELLHRLEAPELAYTKYVDMKLKEVARGEASRKTGAPA